MVPKWRLVVDYRTLNEITVGDAYPFPHIEEILDQLGHAKYFFNANRFFIHKGCFEFIRMQFELKNIFKLSFHDCKSCAIPSTEVTSQ